MLERSPESPVGSGLNRPPWPLEVAMTNKNQKCPCGSGLKYKRCCEAKDLHAVRKRAEMSAFARAVLAAYNWVKTLTGGRK